MSEDKKVEPETTLFRTFSFKGLELRDYFAAKALQGFCSHGGSSSITQKAVAEFAYQMADAMLAEREKQQ